MSDTNVLVAIADRSSESDDDFEVLNHPAERDENETEDEQGLEADLVQEPQQVLNEAAEADKETATKENGLSDGVAVITLDDDHAQEEDTPVKQLESDFSESVNGDGSMVLGESAASVEWVPTVNDVTDQLNVQEHLIHQLSQSHNNQMGALSAENQTLREKVAHFKEVADGKQTENLQLTTQLDECFAKLCHAQEINHYYETQQNNGDMHVVPANEAQMGQQLHDLKAQLQAKNTQISELQATVLQTNTQLQTAHSDNQQQLALMNIYKTQREEDERELASLREQYDTQLEVLQMEIKRLRMPNRYSSGPSDLVN